MKKVITGIAILAIIFVSPQTLALGDKEKGALIGITSLLVAQELTRNSKHRKQVDRRQLEAYPPSTASTGYYEYPSYEEFRRAQVEEAYRKGIEERQRRELEEEKAQAYKCALEGTC